MQIAACGTAWPARHALALALASEQFLWGVAAVAQVLRIPFDPALALAASPPPLSFAGLAQAVGALGARCEIVGIESGGGVALKCHRSRPPAGR